MMGKFFSIAMLLIGLTDSSAICQSGQPQTKAVVAQKKSARPPAVAKPRLTDNQSAAIAAARREARMAWTLFDTSEDPSSEKKALFDEHFAAFAANVDELTDAGVPGEARKPYADLLTAWYQTLTARSGVRVLEINEERCVVKCDLAAASAAKQDVKECVAGCHRNYGASLRTARKRATEAFIELSRQTDQLNEPLSKPKK